MARSASDATRFTATTPTATSKPASSSTIQNLGRGAIPGETPQQKIARLRSAAAAARAGKESQFDKVVRVGRRVADGAHKFTAYSLIGLTVASGIVASFAIGDMLMHNRRKRAEWLLDQQTKHRAALTEARALLARGEHITEDQMLLLNQERAAVEAEERRKNKPGIFSRAKSVVYDSVPEVETKGGELARGVQEQARDGFVQAKDGLHKAEQKVQGLGIKDAVEQKVEQGRQYAQQGLQKVEHGVEEVEHRAEQILHKPAVVKVVGGPLDREAQAVADKVTQTGKSWTDWVLRR